MNDNLLRVFISYFIIPFEGRIIFSGLINNLDRGGLNSGWTVGAFAIVGIANARGRRVLAPSEDVGVLARRY